MLGVGLRRSLARRVLLIEAACVAIVGAAAGVAAGHWLCLADDRRAENVVAGGDLHAVSRSVRHAGKRCHRLCQRSVGVAVTIVWAMRQLRARQCAAIARRTERKKSRPAFRRKARWTVWIADVLVVAGRWRAPSLQHRLGGGDSRWQVLSARAHCSGRAVDPDLAFAAEGSRLDAGRCARALWRDWLGEMHRAIRCAAH